MFFVVVADVEVDRLFFMQRFLSGVCWLHPCGVVSHTPYFCITFKLVDGSRVLVSCKFNFFSSFFFQEEAQNIRLSPFLWCCNFDAQYLGQWILQGLQNGDILILSFLLPGFTGILLKKKFPNLLLGYSKVQLVWDVQEKYLMFPFCFQINELVNLHIPVVTVYIF